VSSFYQSSYHIKIKRLKLHFGIQLDNKDIGFSLYYLRALNTIYFKGSAGVIIVYDISDPQSYLNLNTWVGLVRKYMYL
jgi:hypothetical protein